jgi:3-hydroxyacyl-CoA dehydrogenase
MYRQVIPFLRPDTLVSTGTSSFLIRQLIESFGEDFKRRFYGTHFFNPPDKLILMEFIQTDWNDFGTSLEFESFLRQQLGRRTIKVKDMHGFLANRIGALFLNEVALLAEQYANQGGIGYIDALMGRFTGRALPPLMTIDYIGLDVFTAMLGNVRKDSQPNFNYSQNPKFLDELIGKGCYGKKSGRGLYTQTILPDRSKQKWVLDLKHCDYQLLPYYGFPFAAKMTELQTQGELVSSFQALVDCTDEEAMICKYLLLRYIAIACQVSIEAAFDMKDVDTAMEDGYAWVSPRKLVFLLGGTAGIKKILSSNGNLPHALAGVDAEKLETFQIPAIDSDLRFFSYGRK